jgi:hypothetical protein
MIEESRGHIPRLRRALPLLPPTALLFRPETGNVILEA